MGTQHSESLSIDSRSVFIPGKGRRTRKVYDGRGVINGIEVYATAAASVKEATAAMRRDAAYIAEQGEHRGAGCRLYAQGFESWVFVLPSGASCLFQAATFADAFATMKRDFAYRDDIAEFFVTRP